MTREEILHGLENIAAGEGLYDDRNPSRRALILGEAIKLIEQEPQWIPCSERLPMGSEIVLLTIPAHDDAEGEHYNQSIICGHYIGGSSNNWGISDGTTVGFGLVKTKYGVNPTAWMPLPLPYQPKDGEEE